MEPCRLINSFFFSEMVYKNPFGSEVKSVLGTTEDTLGNYNAFKVIGEFLVNDIFSKKNILKLGHL